MLPSPKGVKYIHTIYLHIKISNFKHRKCLLGFKNIEFIEKYIFLLNKVFLPQLNRKYTFSSSVITTFTSNKAVITVPWK